MGLLRRRQRALRPGSGGRERQAACGSTPGRRLLRLIDQLRERHMVDATIRLANSVPALLRVPFASAPGVCVSSPCLTENLVPRREVRGCLPSKIVATEGHSFSRGCGLQTGRRFFQDTYLSISYVGSLVWCARALFYAPYLSCTAHPTRQVDNDQHD